MHPALHVAAVALAVGTAIVGPRNAMAADPPVAVRVPDPQPIPSGGPTVTTYSLLDVVYLKYRFPGREYKSHIYQSTTGFNVAITPDFAIGGGFIYAHTANSLTYILGKSEGNGVTGFVTATANFPGFVTIGAAAGIGRFSTDQVRPVSGVPSFATAHADSAFFSVYAQRDFVFGALSVTPRIRVLWQTSETDPYIESTGIRNRAERSTLGQLAVGGTVAYAIPAMAGLTVYPFVEANLLYDFDLPLYQRDRTALDLKAGVSATAGALSFGAAYVTIVGRQEYSTYHGGRAFVSYRF